MNKREAQNLSDEVVLLLKQERIKQGITPYRLAKDTGLSKNSVLNIERLSQKPALYTLMIIANYLDISLGKVISEIENK